jgi:hypothetical protein
MSNLKIVAFWNFVPQNMVDIDQQFKGAYCLHQECSDCDTPKEQFDLVENMMLGIPQKLYLRI